MKIRGRLFVWKALLQEFKLGHGLAPDEEHGQPTTGHMRTGTLPGYKCAAPPPAKRSMAHPPEADHSTY